MSVTVRPAAVSDGPLLGRFGAALAGAHHGFDSQRFMLPGDVEAGYRDWLLKEAASPKAVVLVAEKDSEVVGYAYGRLEARDWNLLLDVHAALHDLWVDPTVRGQGAGALLANAIALRLRDLGAPRVVLMSAAKNERAQRLFARLGWRPTMVEMTREL
ncbi:MAG: GNAT family N-acetyltransferase [Myxococcota bacterium]|nr:GNAT family N-acetyltransferase [Myxococcota bacterium]